MAVIEERTSSREELRGGRGKKAEETNAGVVGFVSSFSAAKESSNWPLSLLAFSFSPLSLLFVSP